MRSINTGLFALLLASLAGCGQDYSPNTYSASAVQQANKVERGLVVGFREVQISANGTVGAVSGGAAGGILGAQFGSSPTDAALGGVAGTAVGSLLGTAIEHASGDTTGWEYIVKKPNGEMISVTQKEPQPLPIGQKVLVIAGNQARIIPDYSVEIPHEESPAKAEPAPAQPAPAPKPAPVTAPPAQPVPAAETPVIQAKTPENPVPAATGEQEPKAAPSSVPEQAAPSPAPENATPAKTDDSAPAKEQAPLPAKAEDPPPTQTESSPASSLGGFDFSTPGARLQILERIQAPGGTGSGD